MSGILISDEGDSYVFNFKNIGVSDTEINKKIKCLSDYLGQVIGIDFDTEDDHLDLITNHRLIKLTGDNYYNCVTYKPQIEFFISNMMDKQLTKLDDKDVSKDIEKRKSKLLRTKVLHLLLAKQRDEASEEIVNSIKEKNKLYAVRDDDKKEVWIYKDGIFVPNGATYVCEFCREILNESYTTTFANLVIDKIRTDCFIEQDEFFSNVNKEEIIVRNGILNIVTKKLSPFTQDKIFFQKLDIEYNTEKDCPNIKKFISDIVEDEQDALVVQELFGDLLHKEYKFERCFMLLGDGRNGKSKLGELMKNFVGVKNCCSIHPESLQDPESFAISGFFGKLVNLSLDISSTALKNISMIKSLSGRDLISAPRKFKSSIEFKNYAKMIFGANNLPMTFDTKDSFWERWILLQFPNTFVSEERLKDVPKNLRHRFKLRDNDIISKITSDDEMSGLLNFALEGFERLINNGKFSYKYSPEDVRTIWIMKSDSFSAFYYKYLEHNHDGKVRKNDLRKYYANFCRKNKLRTVSDKMIKRRLQEEGVVDDDERVNGGHEAFWSGLQFKEEYAEDNNMRYSKLKEFESESMLCFTNKLLSTTKKLSIQEEE